jgi:hypothetical protein
MRVERGEIGGLDETSDFFRVLERFSQDIHA